LRLWDFKLSLEKSGRKNTESEQRDFAEKSTKGGTER